jgi:hypothetical protein
MLHNLSWLLWLSNTKCLFESNKFCTVMPFYCYNSKYILLFAVILDSDFKEDQ